MPYTLAELRDEWLALQRETKDLWSAHARHARDADHARAVVKLSRAELDRLSLLLKTDVSREDAALYDMLIHSEQLRLKTAEAKLAQSQRLQRSAKERAQQSERHERATENLYRAEQAWQEHVRGTTDYATSQTYAGSGGLSDRDGSSIRAWRQAVKVAFADYANIKMFPEPPAIGHCEEASCRHGERKLKACACKVKRAFRKAKVNCKLERVRWHPDRFSRCQNAEMVKQAEEVFKVVSRLYEAEKQVSCLE